MNSTGSISTEMRQPKTLPYLTQIACVTKRWKVQIPESVTVFWTFRCE